MVSLRVRWSFMGLLLLIVGVEPLPVVTGPSQSFFGGAGARAAVRAVAMCSGLRQCHTRRHDLVLVVSEELAYDLVGWHLPFPFFRSRFGYQWGHEAC